MPSQDKRLYPLTSCTIGVWRTPDKTKAYLLVLDQADANSRGRRLKTEQKRFVILIIRESNQRDVKHDSTLSVNWLLSKWGCIRQQLTTRLKLKNPFSDHIQQPAHDSNILAFEIRWSDIVGVDFKWPLTEDARLVLEAAVLSKRVFASVEEVCLYYQAQPKPSRSPRMSLNRLLAAGADVQEGPELQQAEQQQGHNLPSLGRQQLGAADTAEQCEDQHEQQLEHFVEGLSKASSGASGISWQPAAASRRSRHQQSAAAAGIDDHSSQDEEQLDPMLPISKAQQHSSSSCDEHQQPQGSAACQYQEYQRYKKQTSFRCDSLDDRCTVGSLSSAPTLSAGIGIAAVQCPAKHTNEAAEALLPGATASEPWEGFGECKTPPLDDQAASVQVLSCDFMQDADNCSFYDSAASVLGRPVSACSGTSSPKSGSPLARTSAAAASGGVSALTVPKDIAMAEGSTQSAGPASPILHPFNRFLEVSPVGYVTAPCSAPNSPKISLGGRTGSGSFFSSALGAEATQPHLQQLVHRVEQPVHQLHRQQQHDRSRYGTGSAGRGRSRLRTQACPLCNQPLVLPLHELQQRFHQKQEQRRRKGCTGGERGVSKSRSACSLEQLLLQTKAHGSNGDSPKQALQKQQHHGQDLAGASPESSCSVGAFDRGMGNQIAYQSSQHCSKVSLNRNTVQPAGDDEGSELASHGVAAQDANAARSVACRLCASGTVTATNKVDTAADSVLHGSSSATVEQQAALISRDSGFKPAADTSALPDAQQEQLGVPPAGVYRTRTVVMTFKDPTLPHKLRQFINSDVHLLKLYESGLPGWAVMLPTYGLYYRPVLRRITWLLFVLLSVISMAMGFYDLYKNVPYFKQFMVAMFRPAAAVFEWLEGHTQIRLSILLTYMLGRTQILVQLIKLLTRTSLQPILGPITAALAPLASAASSIGTTLAWLLQPFISAVQFLFSPINMLLRAAWLLVQLVWQLLSLLLWSGPVQLLQGIWSALTAMLQVFLLPFQALVPTSAGLRAGLSAAQGAGQVARSAVPVVKSSAAAAAANSSWQSLLWYPVEAFELMRVSTMRIMRALQAVVRFLVTLGSTINKHRLSLMLQLRQQLRGGLRAAADSPAGRVASAVAVKMGQEQRVQQIQQQLHRADSGLLSMGSELLGHADSIAVSTALSLDAEMSVSLNAALGEYGDTVKGAMMRRSTAPADADSDEEVTSALIDAPAASPAQLHRSAAGLRHRGQAAEPGMPHQAQAALITEMGVVARGGKQVTFAVASEDHNATAAVVPVQQLPALSLRRSMDAAIAGTAFISNPTGGIGMLSGSIGLSPEGVSPQTAAVVNAGSLNTAERYLGIRAAGYPQQQISGMAVTAEQPVVEITTAEANGGAAAQALVYSSVALGSPAINKVVVHALHGGLTAVGLRRRRNSWG